MSKFLSCTGHRAAAAAVLIVSFTVPGRAEISPQDLSVTRSVSEGDWLNMKLELLGLRLSYPAYRIGLRLSDNNTVGFSFFLSVPLAQHLEEAGRGEAERVLTYHAEGMLNQVMSLLREDFPELWPQFDSRGDFGGVFLQPGDEFDALPLEVAFWRKDRLRWKE